MRRRIVNWHPYFFEFLRSYKLFEFIDNGLDGKSFLYTRVEILYENVKEEFFFQQILIITILYDLQSFYIILDLKQWKVLMGLMSVWMKSIKLDGVRVPYNDLANSFRKELQIPQIFIKVFLFYLNFFSLFVCIEKNLMLYRNHQLHRDKITNFDSFGRRR